MGCGASSSDNALKGGHNGNLLSPKLSTTLQYRKSLLESHFDDGKMVDSFNGIVASKHDIERLRDSIMLEGRLQVFLSSPFGGFEHERKHFMKICLPKLQAMCQSRAVELHVVDFRWGITTEMANENRIIDVCLNEIDNSHIFVGMLGARYGSSTLVEENKCWIEPSVEYCLKRHPWLVEYADRSITEMEWLYAVLLGKSRGCLELPSIFMFRDLRYDIQKAEQKKDAPSEVAKFVVESDECREARDMVMQHVRKLAENGATSLYDNYENPVTGVDKLYQGLHDFLEELLPKQEAAKDAKNFALLRKNLVYSVPSESQDVTLRMLRKFIQTDYPDDIEKGRVRFGVVHSAGKKGMGKSSLLTKIVDMYSSKEEFDVVSHISDGAPIQVALALGTMGDKCFLRSGLGLHKIGTWVNLSNDVVTTSKERKNNARSVALERAFLVAKHFSRGIGSHAHVFNKSGGENHQTVTLATSSMMPSTTAPTQKRHRNLLIVIDDFDLLSLDDSNEHFQTREVLVTLLACMMHRPKPNNVRVVLGLCVLRSLQEMLGYPPADAGGDCTQMDDGFFREVLSVWSVLARTLSKSSAEYDRVAKKYTPASCIIHLFPMQELSPTDIASLANRRASLAGGKTIAAKYVDVLKESSCCRNPLIASYIVDFLIKRGDFENMEYLLDKMMAQIEKPVDVVTHQIDVMLKDYSHIEGFFPSVLKVLKRWVRSKEAFSHEEEIFAEVVSTMKIDDALEISYAKNAWRVLCRETLLFQVKADGTCILQPFALPALNDW